MFSDGPITFVDVAGPLVDDMSGKLLSAPMVDGGGNLTPVLRVRSPWQVGRASRWSPQSMPIEVVGSLELGMNPHVATQTHLTILQNRVRFAAGDALRIDGGALIAEGVTFEPLVEGEPWAGIVRSEDLVGYDAYSDPQWIRVASGISLTGCTIRGTTSPALDVHLGSRPPELTETTIGEVTPDQRRTLGVRRGVRRSRRPRARQHLRL